MTLSIKQAIPYVFGSSCLILSCFMRSQNKAVSEPSIRQGTALHEKRNPAEARTHETTIKELPRNLPLLTDSLVSAVEKAAITFREQADALNQDIAQGSFTLEEAAEKKVALYKSIRHDFKAKNLNINFFYSTTQLPHIWIRAQLNAYDTTSKQIAEITVDATQDPEHPNYETIKEKGVATKITVY